jgi:hypothetical protein
MPNAFIRAQFEFFLETDAPNPAVVEKIKDLRSVELQLSPFNEDDPSYSVMFEIDAADLVSGSIETVAVGDKLHFKCDAIAKINVRPNRLDDFLAPNKRWVFLRVNHLHGIISGLKTEKFGLNTFHFVDVKTASKAKDLK